MKGKGGGGRGGEMAGFGCTCSSGMLGHHMVTGTICKVCVMFHRYSLHVNVLVERDNVKEALLGGLRMSLV